MTTEREFEVLLRSWLDASAAPAQPQDLLESVREATAHSRPRPAWLVRLGGEPMPELARSGLSRFAPIGLAVAAVIVAVLVGLAVIGRPLQNIGPEPDESPTPGATQGATPSTTPTGQARTFGDLPSYQARLASDTVGWLATETSLFRTSDAGQTWTDIQLPRAGASYATSIVDPDTVFVAFAGVPWTIAATHDGGASWIHATIDGMPADADLHLSNQSPSVGAATFFPADAPSQVYQTRDGGASWSGPATPQLPGVGAFLFKIHPAGDRGVITYSNGKYDNVPFDDLLWLSLDGGQTWMQRTFPTDDVSPAGEMKALSGTPWIEGSRWLIAVSVTGYPPSPTSTYLTAFYESTDDGQSWRFINQIPDFQGSFVMLTPTDWIGCSNGSGAACWSTLDGGTNWRQTRSEDLGRLEQLSFASVDHGWGVLRCVDVRGPVSPAPRQCTGSVNAVLLETVDGGQTWRVIG